MSALAAAALGLVLATAEAPAPRVAPATAPRDAEAFVEAVRAATARYQDRDAAIADGYRLIGGDFPGMGEHWIHIGLVFDGVYDPARPEVLTYVTLDGKPRLLGLAYALPLLDGEEPPDEPAGRAAWHAHTGSVDDETFEPHHHLSEHGSHGPRLAMVHAWVWLENPEGTFAADNWAVPFVRLGLTPPSSAAPAAGKALSLLSGGDDYVTRVVRAAVGPSAVDEAAVRTTVDGAAEHVAEIVHGRTNGRLAPEEIDELAAAWEEMWAGLEATLSPAAVARIRSQSMR